MTRHKSEMFLKDVCSFCFLVLKLLVFSVDDDVEMEGGEESESEPEDIDEVLISEYESREAKEKPEVRIHVSTVLQDHIVLTFFPFPTILTAQRSYRQ